VVVSAGIFVINAVSVTASLVVAAVVVVVFDSVVVVTDAVLWSALA